MTGADWMLTAIIFLLCGAWLKRHIVWGKFDPQLKDKRPEEAR